MRFASVLLVLVLFLMGCAPDVLDEPAGAADPAPRWYRGNTHAHTVLSGHGDTSPEAVAQWYLDHGYHFLILSEHNRFIDPDSVALPADRREDFILIPGEEVTNRIHTTAMNVDGLVGWRSDGTTNAEMMQDHVDSTRAAGGTPILNHPNFQWQVRAEDVLPVRRLHHFELYNGHPAVHNHGDAEHPSTEALWDTWLTAGLVVYGVSSDDAHYFQDLSAERSNPGRGWVMVEADALTPDAVTEALEAGRFYATNGVMLADVERGPSRYELAVDTAATARMLAEERHVGHAVAEGPAGTTIAFIGPEGAVLQETQGLRAAYDVTPEHAYVRARVTHRRPTTDGFEAFYAWTQPVFTDGRLDSLDVDR